MMFKPINSWTKQSIVEHIKKNFKGKSIGPDGVKCAYRHHDRKCAVGLFIPDEFYTITMEGRSVDLVIESYGLQPYMPLCVEGMRKLQPIHDESFTHETLNDMVKWVEKNVV